MTLGTLDKYQIDLKGMHESSCRFDFRLDDSFFADIDAADVRKGNVDVALFIKKTSQAFDLKFHTEGFVTVPCDRCLDEMSQPIVSDDTLRVKFGPEYAEDEDNLVVVPEDEGTINVAWFMYEFVALAIPMKHVHAPGECNEEMYRKLQLYLRTTPDADDDLAEEVEVASDEEDKPIDPRWNELKKILDNN